MEGTKQQPSGARSGHQISCCLVSLHFLCDILPPITVHIEFVVGGYLNYLNLLQSYCTFSITPLLQYQYTLK